MEAMDDSESSQMCNLAVLDSLNEDLIGEIDDSWNGFCLSTEALLKGNGDLSFASDFVKQVQNLCNRGLDSLVIEHFLGSLEVYLSFFCLNFSGKYGKELSLM